MIPALKSICLDLGGTNLRTAIISGNGKVLSFAKFSLKKVERTESGVLRRISEILKPYIMKYRQELIGIGLAVPGFIDFKKEIVTASPNYPGWRNFSIKRILHNKFKMPVILENDANAFAIGEGWKGVGKEFNNFVGITLGTGVGGGIVLDRKIWHGSRGSAGEVGHITVEPDGLKCNCGSWGCLEVYASASTVAREGENLLRRRGHKVKYGDIPYEIFKIAQSGNYEAIKIFEKVGHYLGIAIADLANLLNIDGVVLGGGLSNAWEFIYPAIKEQLFRANPLARKNLKIVRSKLGDFAALYGVAKIVMDTKNAFPGVR